MTRPQSNASALLAQSDRLAPEDVDIAARCRATWVAVTGKIRGRMLHLGVRTPLYWIVARLRSSKGHRSDPLELLDRIIIQLARHEWPEAELRLLVQHVDETVTICYTGTAQRFPEQIDVDEQHIEGKENDLQTARLAAIARGQTPDPDVLEQEAICLKLEASLSCEKARALERDARRIRAGGTSRLVASRQAARVS